MYTYSMIYTIKWMYTVRLVYTGVHMDINQGEYYKCVENI